MMKSMIAIAALFIVTSAHAAVDSTYRWQIPMRSCVFAPQSPDSCFFALISGDKTYFVDDNYTRLGGTSRLCIGGSTIEKKLPIRIIFTFDKSGSISSSDPNDLRIRAAENFVKSLRSHNPHSEVGVVLIKEGTAVTFDPIPLTSDDNVNKVLNNINAGANNPRSFPKARKITFTGTGNATREALELADLNYEAIKDSLSRHVVVLIDGEWHDSNVWGASKLVSYYETKYPDRAIPSVHGILVATRETGYELKQISTLTNGLFSQISSAADFNRVMGSILNEVTEIAVLRPVALNFKNVTTGQTEDGGYKFLPGESNNQWQARIPDITLANGENLIAVTQTVENLNTRAKETRVDTLRIVRGTSGNQKSASGFSVTCETANGGLSIDPQPLLNPLAEDILVTATVAEVDRPMFLPNASNVQLRLLVPHVPSTANETILHLDGSLVNADGGTGGNGTPIFSTGAFRQALAAKQSFSLGLKGMAGDFTLSMWVYLDPDSAEYRHDDDTRLGKWVKGDLVANQTLLKLDADRVLEISTNRTIHFRSGKNGSVRTNDKVEFRVWTHIAVVRKGSDEVLYINGLRCNTGKFTASDFNGTAQIGPITGLIDEIRIAPTIETEIIGPDTLLAMPYDTASLWIVGGSFTKATATVPASQWASGNNGSISFTVRPNTSGLLRLFHDDGGLGLTAWSKVSDPVFSRRKLPAPNADKPAGEYSLTKLTVSLFVQAHSDATIYYTLDGSQPSASSSQYSAMLSFGPFSRDTTVTIMAFAVKEGMGNSDTTSFVYRISPPHLPAPLISPQQETFTGTLTVTIALPDGESPAGVVFYYTTDGSTPGSGSTKYTGPVTLSSSTTIKAIAIDVSGSLLTSLPAQKSFTRIASITRASYHDTDADGRIETAVLVIDMPVAKAPFLVRVDNPLGRGQSTVGEIKVGSDGQSLIVTFSPFGLGTQVKPDTRVGIPGGNFDSTSVAVADSAAPTLKQAAFFPGPLTGNERGNDTLRTVFTEPVRLSVNTGDLFVVEKNGSVYSFELTVDSKTDTTISFVVSKIKGTSYPADGDSIRMRPGFFADMPGNSQVDPGNRLVPLQVTYPPLVITDLVAPNPFTPGSPLPSLPADLLAEIKTAPDFPPAMAHFTSGAAVVISPNTSLPDGAFAIEGTAAIYDALGNMVFPQTNMPRDKKNRLYLLWDGRNASGRYVGSGTYIAIIRTEDSVNGRRSFRKSIGVRR